MRENVGKELETYNVSVEYEKQVPEAGWCAGETKQNEKDNNS